MLNLLKQIALTVILFAALLVISPMVSVYESTASCDDNILAGNCDPGTAYSIVFPVIRTAACEAWHQPGCATDTLMHGWSDSVTNPINVVIIGLLGGVSYLLVDMAMKRKR